MTHDQNDPAYDSRDGDPVYHEAPPADSGSASSFDTRHNEFPPEEGHHGGAVDPRTGAILHADGTPFEEPSQDWPERRDAEQPEQLDEGDQVALEAEERRVAGSDAPGIEGERR
ncbi:hypothetical protein [Agrococcus sp. HG114]|uniref:hypothetical protein n=1 Tax=Agrococcus sp. HG114 TaxID=2969757 RepID=UPI00215AF56D|nr:hypothetical protein [Agrococcus sp. HG114]MCR8670805.1 hypothetical protein [Agrococcus sp. HG114]